MSSYIPENPVTPIYNSSNFASSTLEDPLTDRLFYRKSGGTISGRVNFTNKMWIINSTTYLSPTSGNVIDIPEGTTLYFIDHFDLKGTRFNMLGNVSIIGNSSEVSSLTSTGLPTGESLLTSQFTLPIRNITLGCPADTSIFNLVGDGSNGLDLFGVNFGSVSILCGAIGLISNFSNVIITESASLNTTQGMVLSGTIGTIGISNSLFTPLTTNPGGKTITFDDCIVTRRFRVLASSFIVLGTNIGLSIEGTSTFPVESFILADVNFSGGGVYLDGLSPTDNKALITNTKGIVNSAKLGYITMSNNATATTIPVVDTYYKMSGTTVLNSLSQKYDQGSTDNRLRYIGAIQQSFLIQLNLTLTSGNNNDIGVAVFKNNLTDIGGAVFVTTSAAGRVENVVVQSITQMSENDYIEVFVKNIGATTNITVIDMSFIASVI